MLLTQVYFISDCESINFYGYGHTYFELLEKDLKIMEKWCIGYTAFIHDVLKIILLFLRMSVAL